MCGLDRCFITRGISGQGYYGRIDNLKSCVKQSDQTLETCHDNQHAFISFVFYTFGFLTLDVVDLLHRVQRIMHINVMTPRSMNVVFTSKFLTLKEKLV